MLEIPEEPTAEILQAMHDALAQHIGIKDLDEKALRDCYAAIIQEAFKLPLSDAALRN